MASSRVATGFSAKTRTAALIYSAFIAGLCSIIYELLIATTASYFLGNSVLYFSLTIGIYMAAMGVGSYVSKYLDQGLLQKFVIAELCLGAVGGLCIPLLYFTYAFTDAFIPLYIAFTILIGFLIGLEIPFLTRLMEDYHSLKSNIANILSFDYLGALIATLAFPFILLPFFGVYQSSLLFGFVNMSIGFAVLKVFEAEIPKASSLKLAYMALSLLLFAMILGSGQALRHWDTSLYQDRVIYSEQTPYQKIVMTKYKDDLRLFLDGNLQFSSVDEHRYHEALVHTPMALLQRPAKRVLLLGAGDGLAVRELLKYGGIEEIHLVDLDPAIVKLAQEHPRVLALNHNSLKNPKVQIKHADAFRFLKDRAQSSDQNQGFDVIISDLPDPNTDVLARMYSKHFYRLVKLNLNPKGIFVTQATSPYFATNAFWSIVKTIETAQFTATPYHVQVPSFGDWGFVMASDHPIQPQTAKIQIPTRFLETKSLATLFHFEKDIQPEQVSVNRLDQPVLLGHYLEGWRHYAR